MPPGSMSDEAWFLYPGAGLGRHFVKLGWLLEFCVKMAFSVICYHVGFSADTSVTVMNWN